MLSLVAPPDELYLDILPDNQEKCWQESQCFTQSNNCWQAYLNRLFLDSFLTYLKEDCSLSPKIWQANKLNSIWNVVNGTAFTVQNKRFVLLPTEIIDNGEIIIPQEWVDIPSWVADYYLIAEVNIDEQWIRIKGYTTHTVIKNKGTYDVNKRYYYVDSNDIIKDINVLWLSLKYCPEEITKTEVKPLQNLSNNHAENLIQRLGNPELFFPRLEIPFDSWAVLLDNETWREKLYQLRQKKIVKLSNWFNDILKIEDSWLLPQQLNFNNAVRGRNESKVIKRGKIITLKNENFILMVKVSPEENNEFTVNITLHPENQTKRLYSDTKISLLSPLGEKLASTKARSQDLFIGIREFTASVNDEFQIEIQAQSFVTIENFVI